MTARRKSTPAADPAAVLADLESMRTEFTRMRDDLLLAIAVEEERAGIRDVGHFAYPVFAKAARMRARALEEEIERIEEQIDAVR